MTPRENRTRMKKETAPGEPNRPADFSEKTTKSITIQRPVQQVYGHWRNLNNLPIFMPYLKHVEDLGGGRSRWRSEGPAGDVEWVAEITSDRENELISWRTTEDADIEHAGSVQFSSAGDRGTEVIVTFAYNPPAGMAGKILAKVMRKDPEKEIEDALRRFKQVLESGEIPAAQPQARAA